MSVRLHTVAVLFTLVAAAACESSPAPKPAPAPREARPVIDDTSFRHPAAERIVAATPDFHATAGQGGRDDRCVR